MSDSLLPPSRPSEGQDEAVGAGLLRSAVRRDIVDTLANLPESERSVGLSAKDLGAMVGLHVTTVRFHLDQLVAAGLLSCHTFRSSGAGRPGKRYAVAVGRLDAAADEESYRVLTGLLAEMFTSRADDGSPLTPEQAGAAWARLHAPEMVHQPRSTEPARSAGAWLSKVGLMIDVLEAWGYTPNLRTGNAGRTAEVEILRCPFLTLARTQPEVVCGVHRGLLRGTLEVFGETETEVSLEPFVTPTRCLAHLTTRAKCAARGGPS